MKLVDYFKVSFHKPLLESEEVVKESQKNEIVTRLEIANSRMESIEILHSNDKLQDMVVLSSFLYIDLYNLVAFYYGLDTAKDRTSAIQKLGTIPDSSLKEEFLKHEEFLKSDIWENPSDKDASQLEEIMDSLFQSINKWTRNLYKTDLHTNMDNWKKKRRIQGGVLTGIIILGLTSFGYNQIVYPEFHHDTTQLYFLTSESPEPIVQNSVKIPVRLEDKGEWVEYTYVLPGEPKVLTGIRLDPIHQRKMRINIHSIQYLNSKDQVIRERDFLLTDKLIPKNAEEIGIINDLKAGKAAIGRYAEVISTSNNPYFHILLPETKNVSKIKIKMRFIEEYNEFKGQNTETFNHTLY